MVDCDVEREGVETVIDGTGLKSDLSAGTGERWVLDFLVVDLLRARGTH